MAFIYIIKSKSLQEWGNSVGVTKFLFKIRILDKKNANLVLKLNETRCAGHDDWKIILNDEINQIDEEIFFDLLKKEVDELDPNFYPHIRGEVGIFKVNPEKVENHLLLKIAYKSQDGSVDKIKVKQKEMAEYLINKAKSL